MGAAIEIQNVSKRFRLYHEKYSTLKERVLHAGRVPYEEFWALRDVDASIEAGRTVGIVGRNGSGKSTLLKCIAGILQPTSGQIVVRGQLAAMLELGAGFQPDLSGRDNIYLNGSLLGLSRREIDRRFDAIVAFAELENFIDNQVKYYSSGMYVRLGFAVAVNVEPDVLLVDEVLAVGDERFQEKCLARVREFQHEGRTIVVVSHSAEVIQQVCDEVLVLDGGELIADATPGEGIHAFRERLKVTGFSLPAGQQNLLRAGAPRPVQHFVKYGEMTLHHGGMPTREYLFAGEQFTARAQIRVFEPIPDVSFGFVLTNMTGDVLFGTITRPHDEHYVLQPGEHELDFVVTNPPLLEGKYLVNVDVRDASETVLDFIEGGVELELVKINRESGFITMPVQLDVDARLSSATGLSSATPR